MLDESGKKLDALVAKLKAAKGFVPPPLMGEAKAIVTVLRGVGSKYPSPKAKSDDEPDADATTDDSDATTDDATDVARRTRQRQRPLLRQRAQSSRRSQRRSTG